MDIAKDVDGHILVIPKEHCENILDCTYEALSKTMDTVKKVSNHLTNFEFQGELADVYMVELSNTD